MTFVKVRKLIKQPEKQWTTARVYSETKVQSDARETSWGRVRSREMQEKDLLQDGLGVAMTN